MPPFVRSHFQVPLCFLSGLLLLVVPWATALGQPEGDSSATVPRLVKYAGVVKDTSGKPLSGMVGISFALYKDEQGGSPLWLETQNVQADAQGRYSIELGATRSDGLPQDLFVSGEARWLGVRVDGQAEQPRTLLLSVPYALKAGDAETIGGLPPSAFMLAGANGANSTSSANAANGSNQPSIGGSGTQNFIPIWTDNNGDLGNSGMFQSGTGNSAKTGVNTTTPAATLDVNGSEIVRGAMQLPTTGTATAAKGFTSQPLQIQGSSFNSTTQQAIGPVFQLQTEPAGNNTANPSGTLNLLYSNGSGSPTETGLNIASNGLIKFATGQTFPGAGTITGITAGTGLTGGGTSGNVTLSINIPFANQNFANLNNANIFTKNQTINGTLTAQQLISTAAQGIAPLQVTSTTQVPNLNASFLGGLSASAFQPAGSYATLGSNSFTGDQNVTGNVTASSSLSGNILNANTSFNLSGAPFAFGSKLLNNSFFGFAGNSAMTGGLNVGVGSTALSANTSGTSNTAAGVAALASNTTGSNNTAVGWDSLLVNSTGNDNTAIGNTALHANTSSGNTAVGSGSMGANTSGAQNAGEGAFALSANTSGNGNSAVGYDALQLNTTGNNSTAIGSAALISNTTGSNNSAVGSFALQNNLTGSNLTAVGANAGPDVNHSNLTNATAIGANAVVNQSNSLVLGGTGANAVNVGIGTATPGATLDVHGTGNFTGLITFAPNQTFPGAGTVTSVGSGAGLTGGPITGSGSLSIATGGVSNAMLANPSLTVAAGTDLTGGGPVALGGTTTLNLDTNKVPLLGAANVFTNNQTINGSLVTSGPVQGSSFAIDGYYFGFGDPVSGNALLGFAGNTLMTGFQNTATGQNSLVQTTTGYGNTADGWQALYYNTTGPGNTAEGLQALFGNTTGGANTASGYQALSSNQTGNHNAAFGDSSLYSSQSGDGNTAVGSFANYYQTSGTFNTALGFAAGPGVNLSLTNSTAIGADAEVDASNAMVLGSINGVNGATANTNVGIGTTTPVFRFHVGNTGDLPPNGYFRVEGPAKSGSNIALASFGGLGDFRIDAPGVGAGRFVVKESGFVGILDATPSSPLSIGKGTGPGFADGWLTYSSRRWKKNIQTLPDALSKVEQLRGVSYDLKDSGKHEIGVIAEEVGKVVPEVVSFEDNGKDARGVDYSRLTALLIEATKEQQRQIGKQLALLHAQAAAIRNLKSELRETQRSLLAFKTQVHSSQNPLLARK